MPPNPHLDRLSALVDGLAPQVRLQLLAGEAAHQDGIDRDRSPRLYLYLLTAGRAQLRAEDGALQVLHAPCITVCQAGAAHEWLPDPDSPQRAIAASVTLTGPMATLFHGGLDESLVVSLAEADPALRHVIELIEGELRTPRCGQPALLDSAGTILFIGALRHLISHPRGSGGLLDGLGNPHIARVLVAMHERPQVPWTLESLAAEAGMSRTAFANAFRDVMGQTPGRYLTAIRLAIARRAVDQGQGLKTAALQSGYRNASALSRALSRNTTPGAA